MTYVAGLRFCTCSLIRSDCRCSEDFSVQASGGSGELCDGALVCGFPGGFAAEEERFSKWDD